MLRQLHVYNRVNELIKQLVSQENKFDNENVYNDDFHQ